MVERVISHYRILKRLGAGGMGEVYLAEDLTLGRQVALKLLPSEYTQNEERLRRFNLEAKSASALNHPNILIIHEVGEAEGNHFIATEFIDGETLRERLKRTGSMQTKELLNVSIQIASALSVAHQAGIVHRDIKPENIMLRRDGYVKVLDFGLAKLTETAPQSVDSEVPTMSIPAQTETGVVLGTTQYMSPEQATGNKVDARSDIFSFGAVLYEMASAERAFPGSSVAQKLAAIIHQEPNPLPSGIPADLSRIIFRCLRKDPERRYQTTADLKAALEDFRAQLPGPGRPVIDAQKRQRWRSAVWVIAGLAVLLLGLFAWQRRTQHPSSAQPLQAIPLTTLPGIERSPSLSPDGNYAVFSWTSPKENNEDIYVQMIGSGSPLRLTTDAQNDYNPVWAPDGRWIAYLRSVPSAPTGLRNRVLMLKPPLGGPERRLAEIRSQDFFPTAAYLAWSPDSKALVVTDSPGKGQPDALFVIDLETGEKKQITKPKPPVLADTSPALSHDGRSLAFLRRTSWGAGELHLLPLAKDWTSGGELRRLTNAELRADFPTWMPDNQEILFSARKSLWRLSVRDKEKTPLRIPFLGEDGLMPTISRTQSGDAARLVYVRSFVDTNIWNLQISNPAASTTSNPKIAISSTKHEYHCEFSPDGRRVVFTSGRTGDSEIWVSDPDGTNAVQLTSMRAQETMNGRWSPDGRQIAFSSNAGGEFDIYLVSATGGKPRRLTSHPAIDISPTFSRDGKWIYFTSMRSGDYCIWKMPAAGGDAVQVTKGHGALGLESFDGRNIYYLSASVVSPLWRLSTSGGEPVKVLDSVLWFNLCLRETGAYYIQQLGNETVLRYLDFTTGKSATIARNLGEVSAGLTSTPDGKTILFTRVDSSADDLMLVENFR